MAMKTPKTESDLMQAVWGLGATRDARAIGPLVEALRGRQGSSRSQIIEALGNIGGGDAEQFLEGMKYDLVQKERKVSEALRAARGKGPPFPIAVRFTKYQGTNSIDAYLSNIGTNRVALRWSLAGRVGKEGDGRETLEPEGWTEINRVAPREHHRC